MSLSPTGRRIRRAARILLRDGEERLLLFRFTITGKPIFWATPGPEIMRRLDDFELWNGEPVTAHEAYFSIQIDQAMVDTSGHTELERDIMQEHRWFTRAELANWPETIFPADILAILDGVDRRAP